MAGGALAGLAHELILSPWRQPRRRHTDDSIDGADCSSMHSDEEEACDELDKRGDGASASAASPGRTAGSFTAATRLERVESIYGGTRSLYCKSPPLTRANLHRSQSVYAKSAVAGPATGTGGSSVGRPGGPLVPAVSLYPLRLHQPQPSHIHNQNAQNAARSAVQHGISATAGLPSISRAESVYGTSRAMPPPSAHSDDSSYGLYRPVAPCNSPALTYHRSSSYHHSPSQY